MELHIFQELDRLLLRISRVKQMNIRKIYSFPGYLLEDELFGFESLFFSGTGPLRCMISPFKKLRKIWSPAGTYFGWDSFLKKSFSALFEILKSTSSQILMMSSSLSL